MTIALLLTALLFSAPTSSSAVAHGEGTLAADRTAAAPGQTVELRGASFAPGESFSLRLVGVLQEFTLGSTVPAADSTFTISVAIPSDAGDGIYRIEAVAPDGDVSASLDFSISTSAAPTSATTMARADEITIERNTTGVGW